MKRALSLLRLPLLGGIVALFATSCQTPVGTTFPQNQPQYTPQQYQQQQGYYTQQQQQTAAGAGYYTQQQQATDGAGYYSQQQQPSTTTNQGYYTPPQQQQQYPSDYNTAPAPDPGPSTYTTGRTYTVQGGDNLWRIGQRYQVSVDAIRAANGISGDIIQPGQVLTIP